MTTLTEDPAASAPPREQALIDEGSTYSKDYWDLALEQLTRRRLFRVAMWILAVLYGLGIFAPLVGNDRPYKLVAIDYGAYQRSLQAVVPFSTAIAERLTEAEDAEALAAAAEANAREVEAISTRFETMRPYLRDADRALLDEFAGQLAALQRGAQDGALSVAYVAGELVERAELLAERLDARPDRARRAGETPPETAGETAGQAVELVPHTRYPLAESLGWGSIYFVVLWVMGVLFPWWNRFWNRVLLGGDRERIRRRRRAKWAVLFGVPGVAALGWALAVGGGAPAFDVAPFKQGLTDGSIVPLEPPLMPPVPYGYAETHKEESYRPPTWLDGARLDSNGQYMAGARAPKADLVTGYLPPATPVQVRFGEPWPNAPHRHLAGTDELGRDFFVRMLWGARVSLAVGILSAALLTVIGVVIGSIAGYFGGWVDTVIMRIIEILQSIPAFFLILASLAFLQGEVALPPIFIIVIVIALVRWTGTARLVRGEFFRLREQEFVVASRALGFSNRRTIFKHVLPNALGPVLVAAAFAVAAGILTESAVSYLGLGVQLPEASWGSLVNESKSPSHWWVQVFPGLLIFVTVTCYNLVGDAVRDALDPKMKV